MAMKWVNLALLLVSLTLVGVCSIARKNHLVSKDWEPDPDPPDVDNTSKSEHKAMAKKIAYSRLPVNNKANQPILPSEPVRPPPLGRHDRDHHPNDFSSNDDLLLLPPPMDHPNNGFSKITDQQKDLLNDEAVGGAGNAVLVRPPCTGGGGCSPKEELTLAIQQQS